MASSASKAGKAARPKKSPLALEPLGDEIAFTEPMWLQGFASPFYTEKHRALRERLRAFQEKEIEPFEDEWLAAKQYPLSLHRKFYEAGFGGLSWPKEFGGNGADFDIFSEAIVWDELSKWPGVLGQLSINVMALGPVLHHGTPEQKKMVAPDVIQGRKMIALMISEPTAGSDVANIKATAVRQGDHYVVNGQKKWITGGHLADWFTCLVRTGGEGATGLSVLLIDAKTPGIKIRRMPTQFTSTHGTTFVELEEVRVPVQNLIGKEGMGALYIMTNFNKERTIISAGAIGQSRALYQEAVREALTRRTFGKRLIEHQIIRFKLAEMARQIEALQGFLDMVLYQFKCGTPDKHLGSLCALLKVQGSKTMEYCAREAVQIFGGSGIVQEGRGKRVERLYREVRGVAIPGGSEEILLDFAIREATKNAKL